MSFLRDLIFSQSQENDSSNDSSEISTDVELENNDVNENGKRYFICVADV